MGLLGTPWGARWAVSSATYKMKINFNVSIKWSCISNLSRIFSSRYVSQEALVLPIEVDENEGPQNQYANQAITAEGRRWSECVYEYSPYNGTAASPKAMVDALQDSLSWRSKMLWCVVSYVGTTGCPNSRMCNALKQWRRNLHWYLVCLPTCLLHI